MTIFRILFIVFATGLLNACANLYSDQQPAPVFGGSSEEVPEYPGVPGAPSQLPPPEPPVTETRPLEGFNKHPEMVEIKPDLPPPVQPPQVQNPAQPTPPLTEGVNGFPGQPPGATDPFAPEQPSGTEPPQIETPQEQPAPEENAATPAPPAVEAPPEPQALKPLEEFAPQSPAVGSLMMAANEDSQGGKLDSAVASIERAVRIEPRNPALYYKLALLRLKQSKPRLAEDLARKAALLAVNDNNLKKHSWLLVAKAREEQGNDEGAKDAKAEANKY